MTIDSKPPEKSPYEKIFYETIEKFKIVTPPVKKAVEKKTQGDTPQEESKDQQQ